MVERVRTGMKRRKSGMRGKKERKRRCRMKKKLSEDEERECGKGSATGKRV
jgi:hypothetical protein